MRRGIFGAAALAALALLLTIVGAAGAGSYTTGLETFNLGTVDGQDGWHSAVPGDIPALPNGYDQAVVDTSSFGSPAGFGTKALRVSNAYTEPSGEFFFQTYSPSVADPAGETQTNQVFDGTFQFIPTTSSQQSDLFVSVSPDNGSGARMSYVGLRDTANGIHINFYETDANGGFVEHSVGDYDRTSVHTVRFLIQTVPGVTNDIVQLFVDNVDIGERDGACFTTWEQYYREGESHEPGVIDSFEFRTAGTGTTLANLVGQGYLFDNVTTATRNTDGPATDCGAPETATLNVTKFYDANANGTKDPTEPFINDWKVQVADGSTQVGTTPFTASGLAPGDYTASEFSPIQPNWIATTPTSVPQTLAAGDAKSVSFGNVCTGDGGGLTIGFWGNKNGLKLIGSTDLAMLVGLNLRDATGNNFDPATANAFQTWLSKASSTNMAYMLSAQLAAMELNVFNGMVAGTALVYAPGVTGANGAGFITVNDLMTAANTELGLHGSTKAGSPFRSYQQTLMNALNQANQDTSTVYVQSSPCTFTFPGPVCNAASGDANTAYDSYPKDVLGCGPPSYAFEGNSTTEFGDKVTLGAGGTLQSMKVVFNSYGCGVSGKWYTGDCVTAGQTFTVPGGITARIYNASDLTTPLATSNLNPAIPFRPSAIPDASCPNSDPGGNPVNSRFLNPASGLCEYSAKILLAFSFAAGTTLTSGQNYVWTVSFNTTHHGNPTAIGEGAACFGVGGGCGYDSLNVGTKNYTGAPYAGLDPVDTEAVRRIDAGSLGLFTIGTDQRPLGEIIVS